MDTLQLRNSVRREGHFQLFYVLSVGHKQLPGFQRVISCPFPAKRYRGSNRQDLVYVRPSGSGKDFRVSINKCLVLLMFSFYTSTDSGIKRHNCAFVSVLWEYDKDCNLRFRCTDLSFYLLSNNLSETPCIQI